MTPTGRSEYQGQERRRHRRREDDEARDVIIDHAIHDAPLVNRFLRGGKIAAAALTIGTLIGGVAVGLGLRITGPQDAQAQLMGRVVTNSARIDSLVRAIDNLRYSVQSMAFVQCVQVRRSDPDLVNGDCLSVPPTAVPPKAPR